MLLKVRFKSFQDIASVSVPILCNDNKEETSFTYIGLQHLGNKNFNDPSGKYLFIPHTMVELFNKVLIINTEQYEDCFLYTEDGMHSKLGRWMVDIIGKIE